MKYIKENIIYRFGLPKSITIDQGTMFTREDIKDFTKEYDFKLIHFILYYAQANGQVEETNQSLILNIQKMFQDIPRQWHKLLSELFWKHKTLQKTSASTTPYTLTFGHKTLMLAKLTI